MRWTGVLLVFFGAVMFSTKAILVKLAFREVQMDAVTLLALRMLFSMPFFLGAAFWSKQQGENKLTTRQWTAVAVLGLLGYYLSSLFDFVGLQYISAGLERLILFLYPSFVALINFIWLKQVLSKRQRWALLLTYTGLAIAYLGEFQVDQQNPNFLLGSFLIFLCSITYAFYIAGSGKMIPQVGVTRFTAYAMLASTFGVWVHFLLTHSVNALQFSPAVWRYGILLAVFATVIPAFMIAAGMKRIGSNNAAIVSSIGPVSTIVQAYFFLGEKMHAGQFIGTVLVVAGVILIGWKGGVRLTKGEIRQDSRL
ncbi:DMT family transporter [Flavihumibacter petaseus]|uniref:Putative DMT family transporter n=1 Tax=Flavihumibacter petaseus NBRC 106054 TaxID=1220578 RepID=A0A0E9N0Z5_9BACT|nr:DMT family transporter [Flavihumibacter petaseus]GAO43321.1 putative DMT family transporter [Flavihumibacter petaseus NBRC 106054]